MPDSGNNSYSRIRWALAVLICGTLHAQAAHGQRRDRNFKLQPVLLEYALTADEFLQLEGKVGTVVTKKGATYADAQIKKVRLDRANKYPSVVSLLEGDSKRSRRVLMKQLARLTVAETVYEPEYVRASRHYLLIDTNQRDSAARQRLQTSGNRFWEESSPEEMKEFVEEEQAFLATVQQQFAGLNMQLYETEYFLFLTDIPANQVKPYLSELDRMNESLGTSFGFEEGHNVWRGKAVIVAFMQEAAFHIFERQVLNNDDVAGAQGICHSYPNGRVVVGCYRGNSPSFFAVVLVHETAHGYVHRYRSTVRIPSWINEGIADWVAGLTVRRSNVVRERQTSAAARIRLTRTLGGFFQREHIEAWQYGLASSMVGLLATRDNDQFRRFFNDIKNGYTWQDSLQRHYGINPDELAGVYGQELGIPGLRP
jgi:hypothetical protein